MKPLLVILGAGVHLVRNLWPVADKFDPTTALAIGQILAEETTAAIQNKGRVVAVISELHQAPTGAAHVEWKMFREELKKHPAIELVATEIPENTDGIPECSSGPFKEILERHAQVDAIVFLLPLPPWSWLETRGAIPASPAAQVIALGGAPFSAKQHFTGYFTHRVLSVLLCQRRERGSDQIVNPQTPREHLHNEYQIFTPQNYEMLPE
ncbi:MAG: hypothetical protein PCFJNLEI_02427 [Verrucomicrobiae bacterium]|nr:hypothetical protein [Verrucomicrobiae bacterium]